MAVGATLTVIRHNLDAVLSDGGGVLERLIVSHWDSNMVTMELLLYIVEALNTSH